MEFVMLEHHPNDSRIKIDGSGTCQSLTSRMGTGGGQRASGDNYKRQVTLIEKRFFEWHEDDRSVTLRNKSGSYGGGSEVLVICIGNGSV